MYLLIMIVMSTVFAHYHTLLNEKWLPLVNAKSAATPLPAGYMPEPMALDATVDPELRLG